MDKPQIICHNEKSVTFSIYDGKWVPCSAKFVIMGSRPNSKGVLQLYEMTSGDPQLIKEVSHLQLLNLICCNFIVQKCIIYQW